METDPVSDPRFDPYSPPEESTLVPPPPEPHEILRLWPMVLATLILPVAIVLLVALANTPYRPPQDFSRLLGAYEIKAVYLLAAVLSVLWLGCAAGLLKRICKLTRRR